MGTLLLVMTLVFYALVLAWFFSTSWWALWRSWRRGALVAWWTALALVLGAAGAAWAQGSPPPGAPSNTGTMGDLYALQLVVQGGAALAGSVLASLGLTRRVDWLERSLQAMHVRLTAFGVPEHPPQAPPTKPPHSPGQ